MHFYLFFLPSIVVFVSSYIIHAPLYEDTAPPQLRDHEERRRALTTRWQVEHKKGLTARSVAERSVWYVQSVYADMGNVAMSGTYQGQMIFPVDAALFFTGTATDPPLMINLVWWNGSIALHIYTWPLSTKDSVPSFFGSTKGVSQRSFFVSYTNLTNLQIWNPNGIANSATAAASSITGSVHPTDSLLHSTSTSMHPTSSLLHSTGTSVYPTGSLLYTTTGLAGSCTIKTNNGTRTATNRRIIASRGTGAVDRSTSTATSSTVLKLQAEPARIKLPTKQKRALSPGDSELGLIQKLIVKLPPKGVSRFIEDLPEAVKSYPNVEAPTANNRDVSPLTEAEAQVEITNDGISELSLDEDISVYEDIEGSDGNSVYKVSSLSSEISEVLAKEVPKPRSVVKVIKEGVEIMPTIDEHNAISTEIDLVGSDSPEAQIAGTGSVEDGGSASARAAGTVVSMTRVGGKFTISASVATEGARILGLAAAIAFLVVDFTAGHYVAGAISAVGTGLMIASYVLEAFAEVLGEVLGPLGFLLAILPGFFIHVNAKPPANNGTQIIQWSFFGDKNTTGNENCQKGSPASKDTPGTPPSPDCVGVYGPGTLAVTLKLQNYHATVLSIWANDGQPISIPDLAAMMCIMDNTEPNQCANAPFQVDCRNRIGNTGPQDESIGGNTGPQGENIGGSGFINCNQPTYNVQTKLITLPILNETADKIEPRIIGGPNAVSNPDCKIVQFPGAQQFPSFNLTAHGMSSGIACGLENAWNVGGAAVPFHCGKDCSPIGVVSSGENSTTAVNGATVDAPPAVPFAIPGSGPDYVCLEDGTAADKLCLPPLKYDSQGGKAFAIWKVNNLEIPTGFSLSTYYQEQPFRSHSVIAVKHDYTPGSSTKKLNLDMIGIHQNLFNAASFTISGPDPPGPLVCLFDQTSYNGNVLCLGLGGTNLTADWQNVAQSAKMWGAKATFYPSFYGNDAGQPQNGDIDDLSGLKYGTNQDLSKNTYALLIQKAD